jgi:hypothetical protein
MSTEVPWLTLTVERCGDPRPRVSQVTTDPTAQEVRGAVQRISAEPAEVHLKQVSGAVLSVASGANHRFLAFFAAEHGPYYQALGESSDASEVMFIGGSVIEMSAPYLVSAEVAAATALVFLETDDLPSNVEWDRLT